MVHLDGLDLSRLLAGVEDHGLADVQDAGLDLADGHGTDAADLVDVLNGEAEGLVHRLVGHGCSVDGFEEGGSVVPGALVGLLKHVVAVEAGRGDEGDAVELTAEARHLEEVGHLGLGGVELLFGPVDTGDVHLVDVDDEFLHTEHASEEGVFLGLCVDTVVGRTEQHSGVGLGSTGDHVLHEVTVTGRVDDGPVVLRGEELLVSDVDGDSTLALFLEPVHDVGETESGLTLLSGELLVLLNDVSLNVTGVEEETTNGRRLSVVNVTNEHDVAMRLLLVFPLRWHGNTLLCESPTELPYLNSTLPSTGALRGNLGSLVLQHNAELVDFDVVPAVVVNAHGPLAVAVGCVGHQVGRERQAQAVIVAVAVCVFTLIVTNFRGVHHFLVFFIEDVDLEAVVVLLLAAADHPIIVLLGVSQFSDGLANRVAAVTVVHHGNVEIKLCGSGRTVPSHLKIGPRSSVVHVHLDFVRAGQALAALHGQDDLVFTRRHGRPIDGLALQVCIVLGISVPVVVFGRREVPRPFGDVIVRGGRFRVASVEGHRGGGGDLPVRSLLVVLANPNQQIRRGRHILTEAVELRRGVRADGGRRGFCGGLNHVHRAGGVLRTDSVGNRQHHGETSRHAKCPLGRPSGGVNGPVAVEIPAVAQGPVVGQGPGCVECDRVTNADVAGRREGEHGIQAHFIPGIRHASSQT